MLRGLRTVTALLAALETGDVMLTYWTAPVISKTDDTIRGIINTMMTQPQLEKSTSSIFYSNTTVALYCENILFNFVKDIFELIQPALMADSVASLAKKM